MPGWLISPHLADAILVLMLGEFALLAALHRRRGRGVAPSRLWPTFAAGACLLLALRAALAGSGPGLIGAWLAGALVAHVVDIAGRWRSD